MFVFRVQCIFILAPLFIKYLGQNRFITQIFGFVYLKGTLIKKNRLFKILRNNTSNLGKLT